jgi:hypothetical protein
MNTNTNDIMAMMGNPVFTPLKEGKYTCKIEKVGINQNPQAMNLPTGYYTKAQPEGKNNNYFRLDLVTTEGKRINRNVFPENINVVISNIKRQLNIEEDMSTFEVLNKCLTEGCELEMWVWYNESNKNVDFYDAISAREQQSAINKELMDDIDKDLMA